MQKVSILWKLFAAFEVKFCDTVGICCVADKVDDGKREKDKNDS